MKKLLLILLILGVLTIQTSATRKLSQQEAESYKNEVCSEVSDSGNEVIDPDTSVSWEKKSESLSGKFELNIMEESQKSDGDTSKAAMDVVMSLIVYAVFCVLSIVGFVFYCYFAYCCCAKCCQPKQETIGIALKWPLVGTAVMAFGVFIISCIGVSRASGIQDSVTSLFCWGQIALYGASYGDDGDSGYDGLEQLIDTTFADDDMTVYDNHKTNIDNVESYMLLQCTSGSDCCDEHDAGNIICTSGDWGTGNAATVAYQYQQTFVPQGGSANDYSFYFYGDGTTSTWSVKADNFDTTFEDLYDVLYNTMLSMKQQGYKLAQQGATDFSTALDDGVDLVKGFQDDMIQYQSDMHDYNDSASTYTGIFTLVIMIFFILYIVASLATIGLSVLFIFKKPYRLRYLMHISWCFFMITAIFTFLFTTIALAVGYFGQQGCEVMGNSIHSEEKQQDYVDQGILDQDMADKIFICSRILNTENSKYQGNASITKVFPGLADTLQDITDLSDNMNSFKTEAGGTSGNSAALTTFINEIAAWEQELIDVYTAQQYDGNDERSDISNLISYFDTEATSDCGYNDVMIQNDSDCGSGFTIIDNATKDDQTTGSNYCFQLAFDYNGNSGTRYVSAATCGTADVDDAIDNLDAHMAESKVLFEDFKKGQLTSYGASITAFQSDFSTESSNIEAFIVANQAAIDKIAGPDGIVASVECFWLGDQLENAYQVMCAGFVYSIYQLGEILAWFSFFIYFNSFFIYFAVRRLGNNSKIQSQQDKEPQEDVKYTPAVDMGIHVKQ